MKKKWYDYLWIVSLTYLISPYLSLFFREQRATATATAEEGSCLAFLEGALDFQGIRICPNG